MEIEWYWNGKKLELKSEINRIWDAITDLYSELDKCRGEKHEHKK